MRVRIPVPTFGARHFLSLGAIGVLGAGVLFGYHLIEQPPTPSYTQEEQTIGTHASLVNAQVSGLPGTTQDGGTLIISPTHLAIVEQDGSGGQPNPPVNLHQHIQTPNGYTVEATASDFKDAGATLTFYGQVPLIADEFRIERQAVQLALAEDELKVTIWDNNARRSPYRQTFLFTPIANEGITMKVQGDTLSFEVNGQRLGQVQTEVLKDGFWFGASAEKHAWKLSNLQLKSLDQSEFKISNTAVKTATQHEANGLQALAQKKRPGFVVGAAMSPNTIVSDPSYAAIALDKSQLGSWTPENAMKMQFLQPEEGKYYFQHADLLVELALQNGIALHGHALVFGEANPRWFNALPTFTPEQKQRIKHIMQDHITKVVSHFGNKVNSWDVVNEPMADYDTGDGSGATLRVHQWYKAMGESYIATAIATAHKANPDARLFINEWGLEEDGERWDAFVQLMTRLKPTLAAQGVPLEKIGVGFQAHIYEEGDEIDADTLAAHIRQLNKLGFMSQISEMDVTNDLGDREQGEQYRTVFQTCLKEPSCIAWRTWILSDRYDFWKDDDGSIQQGEDGLFDTDMKPRPGYTAIQQLLQK